MELYLIRHGQSTNNALPNFDDRVSDPSLTELGQQQADFVAQHLTHDITPEQVKANGVEDTQVSQRRGYGITKLYCSAMRRALQTAQPIGEALGLTPEVWVDIHEKGGIYLQKEEGVRVGYPGMTRSEILTEFPGYQLPAEITEEGWWRDGYEPWAGCHGRAIKVVYQLRHMAVNGNGNDSIALVTHGGFLDALIKALGNQLPSKHLSYHHFNTAITRVDFDDNERLRLRYMNRVEHLSPEFIS